MIGITISVPWGLSLTVKKKKKILSPKTLASACAVFPCAADTFVRAGEGGPLCHGEETLPETGSGGIPG